MEATSHLGRPLELVEEQKKWERKGAGEVERVSGPAPLAEAASRYSLVVGLQAMDRGKSWKN